MSPPEYHIPDWLPNCDWEGLVVALAFDLSDIDSVVDSGVHLFYAKPLPLVVEYLDKVYARLLDLNNEYPIPHDNQHEFEYALWWVQAYKKNIETYLETGQVPEQMWPESEHQRLRLVAGRRGGPAPDGH